MFKFIQCAANTYYLACYANIGVYVLSDSQVILVDSGDHKKSTTDLDNALTERGLKVKTIINTHSHGDHIWGNKFFLEKYGCDIYAPELERYLVEQTKIDERFFYNAVPISRGKFPLYTYLGADVKRLDSLCLPEGFELLPLDGHSHNMTGIKTPDDVWFLGDALLAPQTYDSYKIPFNLNINGCIKTADMLQGLKGKLFVCSHVPAMEDIKELAIYNANKLRELKEYFYSVSDGKTVEEIIIQADKDMGLKLDLDKYAKVTISVKGYLQALIEDNRLDAKIDNAKMIYIKKDN